MPDLKPKTLHFEGFPNFKPNLTPTQIFHKGAFGGGYFRQITSGVTNKTYKNQHLEFPEEWWEGLDEEYLCSQKPKVMRNKYGVNSGTTLEDWESKNWIKKQDPYGWVQWYCRFYNGRRSDDDERQIDRFNRFSGPKGRFRLRLLNMCVAKNKKYNDFSVSPVIRQGLLHWAYEIQNEDLQKIIKKNKSVS